VSALAVLLVVSLLVGYVGPLFFRSDWPKREDEPRIEIPRERSARLGPERP
jgi:hypothetical protein